MTSWTGSDLFKTVIDIGFLFAGATTNLLLACGTMLAMISLRNGHIAERARNNISEVVNILSSSSNHSEEAKEILRKRKISIKMQNELFIKRYKSTGKAFVWMVYSIVIFPAVFILNNEKHEENVRFFGGCLAILSIICAVKSLIIMREEFFSGSATLEENNKILD